MSILFGKKLSPKMSRKDNSGMERQTPTHVVSDQDLYYLHRSMGISFLNNINDKNIIKQDIT